MDHAVVCLPLAQEWTVLVGDLELVDTAIPDDPFKLLIQSIVDYAIYMLDPTGMVTSWNVGAERIKGFQADEIVGKHFSTFYTAEDQAAGVPAKVLEIARTRRKVRRRRLARAQGRIAVLGERGHRSRSKTTKAS